MKRPLWWVSESSHVERHATRGWHPNRDCDDGDLQWFFLLGFRTKNQRNLVLGDICPSVCDEFHLVRNLLPRHNQAESTTHNGLFWILLKKMILYKAKIGQTHVKPIHPVSWVLSLTELIQPDAFGKTVFKLNRMVVMIMKMEKTIAVMWEKTRGEYRWLSFHYWDELHPVMGSLEA